MILRLFVPHGRFVLIFLLAVLSVLPVNMGMADACPVRRQAFTLVQPDGVSFQARLDGDEYLKVLTTAAGEPVIQEEDGYYCYGYYDAEGSLFSTGYRVGSAVPAVLKSSGASVPYGKLAELAARKRAMSQAALSGGGMSGVLRLSGSSRVGPGTVNALVLLVEFRDLKFRYTKADFNAMLNTEGYSVNGATGSAKDYFRDQFAGKVEFVFDVSDIVTLDRSYRYYGKNENLNDAGSDVRVGRMVYDACAAVDGNVDFSRYDNNKDGVADNVFVIFAGGDEASGAGSDHIWSKSGFIGDEDGLSLQCDGVAISSYSCTSERATDGSDSDPMAGIGTFCHEFCHGLGLPDLYDYSGVAEAMWGRTAIMDRGNTNNNGNTPPNFNAIERRILGIAKTEIMAPGEYSLEPVDRNGRCIRADSDVDGEYFLFECREASGWDSHIGGSGMLIYHIDSSANYVGPARACERWSLRGTYANTLNSYSSHQCADLLEADPALVYRRSPIPESTVARVFFPCGDVDSFTPATDPAFVSWSGAVSELSVMDITYGGGKVSFNVQENEYSGIPYASSIGVSEFQDAAIVWWDADTEMSADVVIAGNGSESSVSVSPYSAGKFAAVFTGLSPSSRYTVSISYTVNGVIGKVRMRQISTHPATGLPPYIYVYGIQRNSDMSFPAGTRFPLRLYNAIGADVRWTMDGKEVSTDASGFYVPESSGLLEAVAVWPDGREYRVEKYIEIR